MPNARKKDFNKQPGFFGFPLDHEAPVVVCDCMSFIRNRGLYTQGVFRVPGEHSFVGEIKELYNEGYNNVESKSKPKYSVLNNLPRPPSVHDIAALLKAFFKDLGDPLIPIQATKEMATLIKGSQNEDEMIEGINHVIATIKSPNRECLGFLISFLREVCTFKRFNQMTADNLATCFVLSLMSGSSNDPSEHLYMIGNGGIVLKTLINKNVTLFMPSLKSVQRNTTFKPSPKSKSEAAVKIDDEMDV